MALSISLSDDDLDNSVQPNELKKNARGWPLKQTVTVRLAA